jgi:hypothetical protein
MKNAYQLAFGNCFVAIDLAFSFRPSHHFGQPTPMKPPLVSLV